VPLATRDRASMETCVAKRYLSVRGRWTECRVKSVGQDETIRTCSCAASPDSDTGERLFYLSTKWSNDTRRIELFDAFRLLKSSSTQATGENRSGLSQNQIYSAVGIAGSSVAGPSPVEPSKCDTLIDEQDVNPEAGRA